MNSTLRSFRPRTTRATVILLTLVMISFGLFAESQVSSPSGSCHCQVQSGNGTNPLFSFVLFQE